MADYEKEYQKNREVCGLPFPQVIEFFQNLKSSNLRILDLGCGQGRDVLLAARYGHRALGVDISETGVKQMLQDARKENLPVEGIAEDILNFQTSDKFDVIILDRILHMFKNNSDREHILTISVKRH